MALVPSGLDDTCVSLESAAADTVLLFVALASDVGDMVLLVSVGLCVALACIGEEAMDLVLSGGE